MTDNDLLDILKRLAQVYPHWRFGQLAANMAGLADVSLEEASNEELLAAARRHLERRLDALQVTTPELEKRGHSPGLDELFQFLRDYCRMCPEARLGKVLMEASRQANVSIFDIEEERLLQSLKSLLVTRPVGMGPVP